jgi:hypothetical protein
MRGRHTILTTAVATIILISVLPVSAQTGRLYGKVYTQDDEVYEGTIRWDKNEVFWDDLLDATKHVDARGEGERRRVHHDINIFGIKIEWTETRGEDDEGERRLGIRMGRLRSIKRRSSNSAVLILKNDTRLRVSSAVTDIGSSNRGIVVEDEEVGRVTLDWSDFERVDFFPEPARVRAKGTQDWRLYGTVTTWDGQEHRGFIIWDMDECLSSDILDGESRGEDLEIPFSKIRVIEHRSSSSAGVELTSGRKLRLRGSNDVNDENRGIVVRVPHRGQVTVEWDQFDRVEFQRPDPADLPGYDDYDAGEPLYGTVWDDRGERYRGWITWDDDETHTYEFLDGEIDDGSTVMLEFADIQSIERRSRRSATVKLNSGESLHLKGTCDVNDENRGIFVENQEGEVVRFDWDDFDRVEFGRP